MRSVSHNIRSVCTICNQKLHEPAYRQSDYSAIYLNICKKHVGGSYAITDDISFPLGNKHAICKNTQLDRCFYEY